MARKFLYLVAFAIVLVITGGFLLALFPAQLTKWASVPSGPQPGSSNMK